MENKKQERDPGVQAIVDDINATKNPQLTFEILCAILTIAKKYKDMEKKTNE